MPRSGWFLDPETREAKNDPKVGDVWEKTTRRSGETVTRRVTKRSGTSVWYDDGQGGPPTAVLLSTWCSWVSGAYLMERGK